MPRTPGVADGAHFPETLKDEWEGWKEFREEFPNAAETSYWAIVREEAGRLMRDGVNKGNRNRYRMCLDQAVESVLRWANEAKRGMVRPERLELLYRVTAQCPAWVWATLIGLEEIGWKAKIG